VIMAGPTFAACLDADERYEEISKTRSPKSIYHVYRLSRIE